MSHAIDRERVWVETTHDNWVGGEVLSRQGNVTLVLLETGEVRECVSSCVLKLRPSTSLHLQEIAAQTTFGRNPESYESVVTAGQLLAAFDSIAGIVASPNVFVGFTLYGARQPHQAPFPGRA